jgi:hypothetical protein
VEDSDFDSGSRRPKHQASEADHDQSRQTRICYREGARKAPKWISLFPKMTHPTGCAGWVRSRFGYFAATSTVDGAGWLCVRSSSSCRRRTVSLLYLFESGVQT